VPHLTHVLHKLCKKSGPAPVDTSARTTSVCPPNTATSRQLWPSLQQKLYYFSVPSRKPHPLFVDPARPCPREGLAYSHTRCGVPPKSGRILVLRSCRRWTDGFEERYSRCIAKWTAV